MRPRALERPIGPIPKGFPINLASNVQPAADLPLFSARRVSHDAAVVELVKQVTAAVPSLDPKADDAALLEWGKQFRGPLLKLLKCPDFVVNRGHYFGTAEFNETASLSSDERGFGPEPALSEDDKHALIEFIKTF